MAAAIKQNEDGKYAFLGRRQPAWHNLGTIIPEDMQLSPAEAIVMAGADYAVRKLPMTIRIPDGTDANGEPAYKWIDADQVAIVREPTTQQGSHHVLGYASKSFEIVQNIELGFMLEPLGREWPIETVGALGEGEQFFITLDAGSASVKGEEIKQYLLMSNAHDGKRAMRVALTPVRVVCQNTLITGISSAVLSAAIPHRSDIREDAQFTLDLISSVRKQQAAMLEEFEAMANLRITREDAEALAVAAYPDPKPWRKQATAGIVVNDAALIGMVNDNKPVAERLLSDLRRYGRDFEENMIRVKGLRTLTGERFEVLNEQAPDIAGTAWGWYQALTEVENYRSTNDSTKSNPKSKGPASTANSILFGARAANMSRGYGACLELLKSK